MSAVSRQGYRLLARALRAADPHSKPGFDMGAVSGRLEFRQWKLCVSNVADELAKDNASFNRSLFLADCGLTPLRLVPGYS
jgi:hypothetical protein